MMSGRIMEMRQALKDGLEREGQTVYADIATQYTMCSVITTAP